MGKTIRQVTFELLRQLNITTVFGNPGSTEETFLKNFPADFRYIQTLHESSAVAAADGYAQSTRNVALVNVHTSAGLSNAMSNILTAYMNRTPLIITAGNQTRNMLLIEPWLTNIKPETLPEPWVKWSYQPVRAEDVPAAFMRAYAMALQPPAGRYFYRSRWMTGINRLKRMRRLSAACLTVSVPTRCGCGSLRRVCQGRKIRY